MNHVFKIPIGDWSGDGHGKCEWYRITSNYPVENVREFFWNACEKAGYKFNEVFCSNYEDYYIFEEQLEEHPIPFDISQYKEDYPDAYKYHDTEYEWVYSFGPSEFCKLLLDWIKFYNPEFEYKFDSPVPTLTQFGFDEKNRHIGHIGYGLFE